MKSFPFDSDVTYDTSGNQIYDRSYNSDDLRSYFHLLFSDGVFANPSTGLQVVSSEQDMSVSVLPGHINIQGALGIEETTRTIVFESAGTVYDRIDSVVARLNTNHDYRKIDLYVIKGAESSNPIAPELKRAGGVYELRLANVFIAKNTTSISAERITDTRLISSDCGIVTANPQAIDTTSIFNQYQAALDDYIHFVEECIDGTELEKLKEQLTQRPVSSTIKYIESVSALPSDAANHPDTLYLVTE